MCLCVWIFKGRANTRTYGATEEVVFSFVSSAYHYLGSIKPGAHILHLSTALYQLLKLLFICLTHKTPDSFILSHVSASVILLQPSLFTQTLTASIVSCLPPPGAPIVVSFPHFYQADPKYINAIDGLNPNKEEHETYLDLQPVQLIFHIPSDESHVGLWGSSVLWRPYQNNMDCFDHDL